MDCSALNYIVPLWLPRGTGKTTIARSWARATVKSGVKSLLIADFSGPAAENTKHFLREDDHELFERVRTHAACPQRDEFRIKGTRWGSAVCENVDLWPTVLVDPSLRPDQAGYGKLHSVLWEEIRAYTHGPILYTFSDPHRGLAALLKGRLQTHM